MSVTCFNLLQYDTMQSSRWLPVSWRNTLIPSTGQKIKRVCPSKMLVITYPTKQCHNKEYHNMKLYGYEILKVHIIDGVDSSLCLYDMTDTLLSNNIFTADNFTKSDT
jgi:hypothetical protein